MTDLSSLIQQGQEFVQPHLNCVFEYIESTPKWVLIEHVLATIALVSILRAIFFPDNGIKKTLLSFFFTQVKKIPAVKRKIAEEQGKVKAQMETQIFSHAGPDVGDFEIIPKEGISHSEVIRKLEAQQQFEVGKWQEGKVSGAVYHGGKEMSDLATKAFSLFSVTNPLHSDLFPCVRKMEAEVVRMTVNMLHGDAEACGTMTSGGTESILMACKAYRDWGRAVKGIKRAEIICCVSAHAAFDKAGSYFGIKIIRVPHAADFRADVGKMKSYINRNTVALVASAPEFPHGVIDPVEELSSLALRYNIGLHVDCCLGGFFLPWAELEGFAIPPFDFRVPGVTTISADTHKYGFATKGSSVVTYRNSKLRAYQYFVAPDWTGGIYASPSIAGSRPGAMVAACWAAMLAMGQDGYRSNVRDIMNARIAIQDAVAQMPDLEILGNPVAMVVSFAAKPGISTYAVADAMSARGWNLNSLQYPPSIHICCTRMTVKNVEEFKEDLAAAVTEAKSNPDKFKDGAGAIYGLAASIPDRTLVDDIARAYMDTVLKTKPSSAAAAVAKKE
eukprot:TRINITY_DN15891_c0_g1_i1.p1 TRINITY_DN15891_c0_g1~~TRINITY_DN15891_c0_g1_i1.p1  ORF type:complete len:559 (+),score=141.18 TRINITY_DN15891_c0_g1_i1:46-1722(+)